MMHWFVKVTKDGSSRYWGPWESIDEASVFALKTFGLQSEWVIVPIFPPGGKSAVGT